MAMDHPAAAPRGQRAPHPFCCAPGRALRWAMGALAGLSCAAALAAVGWNPEPPMAVARGQHGAGLLDDGSVVVVGGITNLAMTPSAERYAAGAWTGLPDSGLLGNVVEAVTLATGQLLARTSQEGARLFDPASQTWQPAGTQTAVRHLPTMTLLADGRVLVAGGSSLASAELYDPRTRTWTATGSMATGRQAHAAVLLRDGRVLVASGFSNSISGEVPSAELYDPATGTWSPAAPPLVPRHYASLTLLPNGRALLAGGFTQAGAIAQAELYDPVSNTWTATGNLHWPRNGYGMGTVLPSGQVLMAGGSDTGRNPQPMAELYTPATGTWSDAGAMAVPRENMTSTLLPAGDVLVAGGLTSLPSTQLYPVVERYSPAQDPGAVPVLDAQPLLLQAGAPWVLTGAGFTGSAGASTPQLRLQRAENGALWQLAPASFTATAFATTAPGNLPAGLYLASVVVDGVASTAQLVRFMDAPAAPSAAAGTGQATVSWSPLANDRGNPPEGYVVTSEPASAGCTAAVPAGSCTVAGLNDGTSYVFYVQARHANGLGPRSPASNAVTASGPAAPATPTAVPGLSGGAAALLSAALAGLAARRRLRASRR